MNTASASATETTPASDAFALQEAMNDVTERVISDIQYAARFSKVAGATPAKGMTTARAKVLAKLDGRLLGYVSNAPIYDEGMRDLSKSEHKTAISLILGGFVKIEQILGPLPGDHAKARVGAREAYHYKLTAK